MKKTLFGFSLLCALTLGLAACDDSKDDAEYCDAGYNERCEDGVYLKCETADGEKSGKVSRLEVIDFHGAKFVCNDNNVIVPQGCSCKNGSLVDASGKDIGAMCGIDNQVVGCNGNEIVQRDSWCNGNTVISCNGGTNTQKVSCGNDVCVEYERGDMKVAQCYAKENVTDGCGETTIQGTCSATQELTFCTSADPAKGKTVKIACTEKSQNGVCAPFNKEYGNDCSVSCKGSDGQIELDRGRCDGDMLIGCAKDGSVYTENCAEQGKVCGVDYSDPINLMYDCIAK